MMGYFQFKKVWLSLVDVRAELRNRHEKFNRFLPDSVLMKKLQVLVNLEEKQEATTLLEAANALDDEKIARERRHLVEEALVLSRVVIGEALDAAGHVYLFGKGPFNCFDGDPMEPDFVDFIEYELVKKLWKERVRPDSTAMSTPVESADPSSPEVNDNSEKIGGGGSFKPVSGNAPNDKAPSSTAQLQSLSRIAVAAAAQAFESRQVSLVTAFLWGKRVKHIACGSVVAFAVTDSGEVFCWGGKQRKWQYFYDHSTLKDGADGYTVDRPQSRGGERPFVKELDRPLTTRSEMLKFSVPSQVAANQTQYDQLHLRRKYRKTFVKPEYILPTDEDKQRRLLLVGRYYDLLPANNDQSVTSQKAPPSLHELMETVEPELNVDDLALSLQVRGVYLAKQTRIELMEKLGNCLELEIECTGVKFHEHLKDQDKLARRLRHDRMENPMLAIAAKTAVLWHELCLLQESIITVESETFSKGQREYLEMKRKILAAKQKIKRQAKEGFFDADNKIVSLLHANGLTSRGSPMRNFNGQHAVECLAVGSRHALAVHQSGKLLTWGVGSFGRLGGAHENQHESRNQKNDPDAWHGDVHSPEFVDALKAFRFRSVACGFGHSLALSTQGQVFVWGSATHGKLGIGKVDAAESFTLSPMPLQLPTGVVVRKIACGPSHSALLTSDGHLYVWGSGDGGKLGLGDGRDIGQNQIPRNGGKLGLVSTPTRVLEPFAREKLVDVSCGTGHTVVISATSKTVDHNQKQQQTGGLVYVAGSNHALAKFTPTFTHLPLPTDNKNSNKAIAIAKVSCGNAHTALVSSEGELFTWGKNVGGCTGHSVLLPLIKTPTRVGCMYQRPANLCLLGGVTALQSTQNATCLPEYALRRGGGLGASELNYSQTQQELCPFWQVALQRLSRIESVRVVIKKPVDSGGGSDDDSGFSTKRPSTSSSANLKTSILISQFPFDTEERGKYSLAKAKSHSTHVAFSLLHDDDQRNEFVWTAPVDTLGKFVRIQIENPTIAMLSLDTVEVVGMDSTAYKGPKVTDVECGDGMTIAICRPLSSVEMLRERFLRAVRADRASLWILEQIETFHPFLQDELVKSGHQRGKQVPCVLCRPRAKCVVCQLEEAILTDSRVNLGPTTKQSDPSNSKLEAIEQKRDALKQLTLEELCHQLLNMNMRTEEEEQVQQKRLEQELLVDATSLALAKQEEEQALVVKHVNAPLLRGPNETSLLSKLKKALGLGRSTTTNQKEL